MLVVGLVGIGGLGGAALVTGCGSSSGFVDAGSDTHGGGDGGAGVPDFVWFVLDETQGTTAKDSSPNHYDITNLTGVTWDHGANFDGASGGGSVAVGAAYRSPPITITAWLGPSARADSTSTTYVFNPYPTNGFGDDLAAESGYGLGLNVWTDGTPGAALAVEDVDDCVYDPTMSTQPCLVNQTAGNAVTFSAGQEYFVAATIAADGSAHVYVDGALFNTSTAGPITSAATTLWLGQHNDDAAYATKRVFAGRIRDARVYKRELSAGDVADLHAAGPTTVAP
jgi:Concanavalin A-like lectin/glucanases superfamily